MFDLFLNDTDTSTVTVSTGRCGLGKSTVVRSFINYCLLDDAGRFRGPDAVGLIVITDMIGRAEEYLSCDHDRFCAFITAQDKNPLDLSPAMQMVRAKNKPVIILTTQRFFSMDESSREDLFQYKLNEDTEFRRRKIAIIDEKPYFYTATELRVRNFNECDTALHNLPLDYTHKGWLIEEYERFRDKMLSLMHNKECDRPNKNKDVFFWMDNYTTNLTSNDELFFNLLQAPEVRKCLLNTYPDFFRDMDAFKELMTGGAFFIAAKAEVTSSQFDATYFLLPQDNRHVFYLREDKAKFFVLDGTANIDPDYNLKYINIIDDSAYNINLPLTIKHIDARASRYALVNGDRDTCKAQRDLIQQDILSHIKGCSKLPMLVASYQAIEKDLFADTHNGNHDGYIETGHFGGLRGINKFRDLTSMAIIGFNRQSELSYYIKYISQNPHELELLRSMGEELSRKRIHIMTQQCKGKGTFLIQELNEIMFGCIMADLEQNIFRLSLRNYLSSEPVTVFTYWNCHSYDSLNQLIWERYAPYGARIFTCGKPVAFEQYKTEKRKATGDKAQTSPQRVLKWAKAQVNNRILTATDIREETGLSPEEWKNAKRNKAVKSILNSWKTEHDGEYVVRLGG